MNWYALYAQYIHLQATNIWTRNDPYAIDVYAYMY